MNITKREKLLMMTTIVALFAGMLVGAQMAGVLQFSVGDGLHEGGYFDIVVTRADGTVVLAESYVPNVITTIGKKHARNLMGSLNTTYTNALNRTIALAVSDDASASAAWTKLPTELTTLGLDRKTSAEVTFTVLNGTAYKTEYTWTKAGGGSQQVQAVGVHWSGVDGSNNNLYAAGNFTPTTLNDDDTIKLTYTLNYG